MGKLQKTTFLCTTAAVLILGTSIIPLPRSTVYALDKPAVFTDVPRDHWAWKNGTLSWAAQAHIVAKEKETTFLPAQIVTEEEFLTMMMRLFANTKQDLGSESSDDVYRLARQYNLPAPGDRPEQRATELTRLQVARLLAAANGKHYDDEGAIVFLYEHGITKGADGESTIAGFGGTKKVSRVEAVQFLKMAYDKGIASLMQIMPPNAVSNPSTSQFISSSPEVVAANLQKAQTAAYTRYDHLQDKSSLTYWSKQLYETARKLGRTSDSVLHIPLPAVSANKTLVYHVAADRWHSGEITGGNNAPASLEFPASAEWSVLLIIKEGNRIVGDMYYDTTSESIEINNVIIQKHVKK